MARQSKPNNKRENKQTKKRKTRHKRYLENLKQRGIEYYDKIRLEKIQRAKALI